MRHHWTEEECCWIREHNTRGISPRRLLEEFNEAFGTEIEAGALMRQAYKLGIKGQCNHKITEEELAFLWENGAKMPRKELTELFNARFGTNMSVDSLVYACRKHRIPNARNRIIDGKAAPRLYPLGSEKVNEGYVVVKVGNTGNEHKDWIPKQRILWEKAYGKIPEGCRVAFLDNDRNNFSLENLCLTNLREMAIMNRRGWHEFTDPELKKTAFTQVRLHLALNGQR